MANWDSLRREHISDSAQFSGCLSRLLQDLPIPPPGPGQGVPIGVPSTPPACCCSPTRQPALTSCPTRALAAQRWRLAGRAAKQAGLASSPSCTWLGLDLDLPVLLCAMGSRSQHRLRGLHSGTCERPGTGVSFSVKTTQALSVPAAPQGAVAAWPLARAPSTPVPPEQVTASTCTPVRGVPLASPPGPPQQFVPNFHACASPPCVPSAGPSAADGGRAWFLQILLRRKLCCSLLAPKPCGLGQTPPALLGMHVHSWGASRRRRML